MHAVEVLAGLPCEHGVMQHTQYALHLASAMARHYLCISSCQLLASCKMVYGCHAG